MNRLFFIILVGLSHHANAAYFKYYMTKSDEVIKVIYSEDLFENKSSRSFRIKCSNVKYLRFLYKENQSDDTYTEVDPSWIISSEEWSQIIIPESHKTKPIYIQFKGDNSSRKHVPSEGKPIVFEIEKPE